MQLAAPLHELEAQVQAWNREMIAEMALSPGTVAKYVANAHTLARVSIARGARSWADCDRSTVLAYVSAGTPSASTRRLRLNSARAFFRWLGIPDPSAGLRLAKRPETMPDSLTVAEVRGMLESCDRSTWFGVRDRAILELAYSTGARAGEIAALTLADLRLEQRTVRLTGKGSKQRPAYLTEDAAVALQAWLEAREGVAPSSEPSVFVSQALTRFSAMGLWKVFTSAAKRAGIARRVHPHLWRHTAATHWMRAGADVRAIQRLLGHASIATTQVYLAADDAWVRDVHRRATEGR